MKLLSDTSINLGYYLKNDDFKTLWDYGDYMKKVAAYVKNDDENLLKLQGEIEDTQNTEWPSKEAYKAALLRREIHLRNYLGTHENPFLI